MAKPPINKEWKMTDRKKLFDKPNDEMKLVFVRSRFRAGDVFRRENIEEWLAEQRRAEKPELGKGKNDEKGWNDLFHVQYAHRANNYRLPEPLPTLNSCATPYVSDVYMVKTDFAPFLRALVGCLYNKDTLRIYEDNDDHLLVVVSDNERCVVYYEWAHARRDNTFNLSILELGGIKTVHGNVYSVLLDEWQKHRSKWEAARSCLCDQLGKCIERERTEAEKYFSEAVALTADGKDIVRCEEVVVIDGHRAIIFPPAAFAKNKILANPAKHRFPYDRPMSAKTLRFWLSSLVNKGLLEKHGQGQFFAEYRIINKLDKTRFVTDIRFCPDPLPAGGVEIQLAV